MTKEYFEEFEKCYGDDPFGKSNRAESDSTQDRWRSFAIDEIKAKDYKIDGLKWLKDELGEDDIEAEPLELAQNATLELTQAIQGLNKIIACLEDNGNGQ
ncbi:MAG: Type I restriction enzyme EcoKI M protein [Spirochaetes bacterium ADurb.Bin218]|nr:MAG: Type I restriction enzyme EcoKI M protein [Spirochaetes bacterium ADurb.Bin218]